MNELKQIKRHHERQLKNMDKKLTMYQIHPDDVSWLIKQAERAEELEEERDEWKDTAQFYYMTNQELREQNKRYREALEEIRCLYPLRNVGYQVSEIRKIVIKALEGTVK